jgi:Poly(ADP-ribose) polymerase catalytic domain
MSPSDRDVYEAIPAGVAANAALAPVGALQVGRAIKGAGVAAKVARWGANTAANEAAANLVTDNTMGGPSSLLKAVGVPVPDALSADPTRDDRISAGLREIPASMVFAGALGGAAGVLERFPHIARALRDNRSAQEQNRALQRTVTGGLQEESPATGGLDFTQTATTPPPPPPPPAPTKPVGSVLEQDAAMLGITPEALAASRGVPYSSTSQPAPAAAPTPAVTGLEQLGSNMAAGMTQTMRQQMWDSYSSGGTKFAGIEDPALQAARAAGVQGTDRAAFDSFLDRYGSGGETATPPPPAPPGPTAIPTTAPEAPAAAAAPAPMATPEPAAPKVPAAADEVEPVYDPELPEIDHIALALERLDPAVVEQIVQTPGPVLPRIEEALANRQPVTPRPELEVSRISAPSNNLAEMEFPNKKTGEMEVVISHLDQWTELGDDALLGAFHPQTNPDLFDFIHGLTAKSYEELTRSDALEALSSLRDKGMTLMPARMRQGQEFMAPQDMAADPGTFQYKGNTDKNGVQPGGSLDGVTRWSTHMEQQVMVWDDPKRGQTFVVNGHNSRQKALDLGIPSLPIERILAKTPQQARIIGALRNIGSGGGNIWDAGKFFRDTGITTPEQIQLAGVPLAATSGHGKAGLQLAALPDNIFQAGLMGELDEAKALQLGGAGLSPEKMQSVWGEYQADKFFRTEEGFRDLIDLARDTPTTKDQTGRIVQDSLPGLETAADRDLTKTKLKLARKVAGNLRTDKNALRGAARNAPTLEGKGNSKIDANASMQAGLETAQLADVFDALKFKSDNDISRLLNEGAAEIAAGSKMDMVARRIQGELAQAAEGVVMPARAPEPVAPVEPELPMPKTAKDHEANQMLVLNRAAAQGEVRPSATPIPVPPAPPEIDVAKAAKGIDALDVMGGDSQLKFAQQQRQQALDAGDATAVEAWDKEIRKVNQGRLGAAMDAQDASQTGLFGVTEYDNSMPLFDQSKLDAEEARLAAEYLERDTAMQQEVARAEREAMGYNDMTFDQKKAEAGIAEGWAPAEMPPGSVLYHGTTEAGRKSILANGFRASNAEKAGTVLGEGAYFTGNQRYANAYGDKEVWGELPDGAKILDLVKQKKTVADLADKVGVTGPRETYQGDVSLTYEQQQQVKDWATANGYQGIRFKSFYTPDKPEIETVIYDLDLANKMVGAQTPEPAAPPARAIEIPAAADKKLSPDRVQSTAEILMKWANANLFQGQWPVKSIDEAIALVRAKNRQLWSENIPGIDLDKANNDLAMGRNSPAVQDVSNAYRQFYGVKAPEGAPKTKAAPPSPAETKALFDELAGQLRDVDGGKLKGVSKKALDAAEKGDPEQALAEATDYANRRMAQLRTEIEDIKRRAIEEGC